MVYGLNRRIAAISALWVLCCGARIASALEDKVTLFSGKIINGQITKDEIGGMEVTVGGGATQSCQLGDIKLIEWGVDDEWVDADASYRKGNYNQASSKLRSLMDDRESVEKLRSIAKPYFYYIYAVSLLKTGKSADAAPVFKKLFSEYPKASYVPDAFGMQIDALLAARNYGEAKPLLSQLRQLPGEPQRFADCLEGEMLRAQGDLKKADTKFSAAATGSNDSRTKARSLMGQAGCALDEKNTARARELAQKILSGTPAPSMAAAAHLILGDAMMIEADAGKLVGEELQNKLTDALLEYMRIQLQYPGDPNSEPASLLKGGECLQRLSKLPNHGIDRQRALELYSKLTGPDSRYKNTVWAEKANENIKSFK